MWNTSLILFNSKATWSWDKGLHRRKLHKHSSTSHTVLLFCAPETSRLSLRSVHGALQAWFETPKPTVIPPLSLKTRNYEFENYHKLWFEINPHWVAPWFIRPFLGSYLAHIYLKSSCDSQANHKSSVNFGKCTLVMNLWLKKVPSFELPTFCGSTKFWFI